jgi:hypothetical protein
MTTGSNKMIGAFDAKPLTLSFFTAIADYTQSLGTVTTDTKARHMRPMSRDITMVDLRVSGFRT